MGQCCTTTQKEEPLPNTQNPQSIETEKLIQNEEKQSQSNVTAIESDKEDNITKNKPITEQIQNDKNAKNTDKYAYKINDHVLLTNDREGIILFIGEVEFTRGILYGIELLNDATGKHDGMIKEKRYFQTKPKKGTFIRENKILGKKEKKKKIKNKSIEPKSSNNGEDNMNNDVKMEPVTETIDKVIEENKSENETNDNEYKQEEPLLKDNDKILIQEDNVISIMDDINMPKQEDNVIFIMDDIKHVSEEEESENKTTWLQPRQDAKGTCVYHMDYNQRQAKKDAKIIRSALVNNNNDKLLEMTGHRNNKQRMMIRNAYKTMYAGKQSDLMWILRNDPTNQLLSVCYRNICEFDALMIYKAISGQGIDKYKLNEIVCTRTNNQINEMKNAWNLLQDEEIKHWINGRSIIKCISTVIDEEYNGKNNDYKEFIIGLLNAKRTLNSKGENPNITEFAELLLSDKRKRKRNQKQMCERLNKWSFASIRALYKQFNKISNTSLLDVIEHMFENNKDLCDALCVIITFCTDPYNYWSLKIKDSLSGKTNYEMLTRYIVTRCEIDLYNIINIFNKDYGDGKTLKEWIENETTGYSQQLLLLLCGYTENENENIEPHHIKSDTIIINDVENKEYIELNDTTNEINNVIDHEEQNAIDTLSTNVLAPQSVLQTESESEDNITDLRECDHENTMYLLNYILNNTTNIDLIKHKESLLIYCEKNEMDGHKFFLKMNGKIFAENICNEFDNKELEIASAKLYSTVITYDLSTVNWNNNVENEEIEEEKYETIEDEENDVQLQTQSEEKVLLKPNMEQDDETDESEYSELSEQSEDDDSEVNDINNEQDDSKVDDMVGDLGNETKQVNSVINVKLDLLNAYNIILAFGMELDKYSWDELDKIKNL